MPAVRALIEEGLVVTGWGQGKYVREDYPPVVWNWTTLESRSRHANAVEGQTAGDQWSSAITQDGQSPRQEITVSIVEPPPHVRDALALPDDGLAVARKRIRYIDNRPYALADSYFPQELVSRHAPHGAARCGSTGRRARIRWAHPDQVQG